jgi:16S rRNA (uracil1498-N3)-methyltransferase
MEEEDLNTMGRFFVEVLPSGDEAFELPPDEAAHATWSRRLTVGDTLTLFDGSGWDVIAEIVSAQRGRTEVRVVARRMAGAPLPFPVTCATALPKGSREDILVSKCAELGVTKLVPVEFERSVVKASVHWQKRMGRYRRLAIEAAKQSGASTIMEIGEPVGLRDFVTGKTAGLWLIGDPCAGQGAIDVMSSRRPFTSLTYLVGPEGGITAEEMELVGAAAVIPVRIAATVLRIETAAVGMAAVAASFLSTPRHV